MKKQIKEKRKHLVTMIHTEYDSFDCDSEDKFDACKFLIDNNFNVLITNDDKKYLHKILEDEFKFFNLHDCKYIHYFVDNLPSNLRVFHEEESDNVPVLIKELFEGCYPELTLKMEEKRKNTYSLNQRELGEELYKKKNQWIKIHLELESLRGDLYGMALRYEGKYKKEYNKLKKDIKVNWKKYDELIKLVE